MSARILSAMLAALWASPPSVAQATANPDYRQVIRDVAGMVHDPDAQRLAQSKGLQILNVLWEDTGRWQGSSVGPNISDVTIEVGEGQGPHRTAALMPVIRHPNFTDKTADVRLDKFYLKVGNERQGSPEAVITLREFLSHPTRYMSLPKEGSVKGGSLLAPRDTHALVSAQAAFLPIPKGGKATFYPVIFNYQSTAKNPAVLTLMVTRQGTSMTIVDNARDTVSGGASWGQRLFFNAGGQRAPLTAERLSDVQHKGVTQNGEAVSSLGEDMNLLMLIQVPLKYREPPRAKYDGFLGDMPAATSMGAERSARRSGGSDMEVAVLGHGELEGPYTELDKLTIERDPRFPVRVTVQFYQATSHAHLGAENMAKLAQQIARVYEKGDYVGSLVVPSPQDLQRPTNWDGVTTRPSHVGLGDFPGLAERYFKHGDVGPRPIGID
jgi:hypothetical protein